MRQFRFEEGAVRLRIAAGPDWRITADTAAHEPTDVHPDMIEAQRVGPVWATQRHLRRRLVLHAGAFLIDDQAFALAAFPRTGKSTLAAALRQAGAGFLADDLTSIGDDLRVEAGPPFARMWPDTAEWAGVVDDSRIMVPGAEKRIIDMAPERSDAPLAGVFLMQRGGPLSVRRSSAVEAVPRLAAMTYLFHMYRPAADAWPPEPWHLDLCTSVAKQVPVWELTVPDDMHRLPDAAATVLATAREAPRGRP